MNKRQGSDPTRRIAPPNRLDQDNRERLAARLRYVGSAHHKRRPGDYGFQPPCNPRPTKSLCDGEGKKPILKAEAEMLFRAGVKRGMFSVFDEGGCPKYVWAVDELGDAYESKVGLDGFHGYRLEMNDPFRDVVLKEWRKR